MGTQKVGKIHGSHEKAKEVYDYDLETGFLAWRIVPSPNRHKAKIGDRAGWGSPYRWVMFNSRQVQEHRFIWFWMTGESAEVEIDHIDGNSSNNKWNNLRLATSAQQQANQPRRKLNKLGFRCVDEIILKDGTIKYYSDTTYQGKYRYLGTFATPEEAYQAYQEANKKIYGEYFAK